MFANLFGVLLIENSRGNPSFCWLGGGGLRGTKIVNKNFVNKLAFPKSIAAGPLTKGALQGGSPLHSQNCHPVKALDVALAIPQSLNLVYPLSLRKMLGSQ